MGFLRAREFTVLSPGVYDQEVHLNLHDLAVNCHTNLSEFRVMIKQTPSGKGLTYAWVPPDHTSTTDLPGETKSSSKAPLHTWVGGATVQGGPSGSPTQSSAAGRSGGSFLQ